MKRFTFFIFNCSGIVANIEAYHTSKVVSWYYPDKLGAESIFI